jgi:hypothetical protein
MGPARQGYAVLLSSFTLISRPAGQCRDMTGMPGIEGGAVSLKSCCPADLNFGEEQASECTRDLSAREGVRYCGVMGCRQGRTERVVEGICGLG